MRFSTGGWSSSISWVLCSRFVPRGRPITTTTLPSRLPMRECSPLPTPLWPVASCASRNMPKLLQGGRRRHAPGLGCGARWRVGHHELRRRRGASAVDVRAGQTSERSVGAAKGRPTKDGTVGVLALRARGPGTEEWWVGMEARWMPGVWRRRLGPRRPLWWRGGHRDLLWRGGKRRLVSRRVAFRWRSRDKRGWPPPASTGWLGVGHTAGSESTGHGRSGSAASMARACAETASGWGCRQSAASGA